VIAGDSKVGLVRKIAAIVLASAFLVSVAACADLPAEVQNCVPTYHSGAASDSISATGEFGKNPKAKIPTPTVSSKVEVSALKKGTGLLLGPDDIADLQLSLYTASDGKLQGSTGDAAGFTKASNIQITVGLTDTIARSLECQRVGTRVATVLTAKQYFGSTATAVSQGVPGKTVLVVVMDITNGYRGRAVGILQPLQSGFPSVVTAPDGTPGVTLDLQEPPKTLQSELVRGGSGAKVKAGQRVLLQVQAIAWTDPAPTSTFDSTWKDHTPRYYTLTALTKNAGGESLDPGSVKSLIGQRVGSQVLVVVPPKYGYPSGKAPSGYPTGETLIFVYDILGTY
jgi:FKBP-type peptidyl-prolyl cis-trans isomerase